MNIKSKYVWFNVPPDPKRWSVPFSMNNIQPYRPGKSIYEWTSTTVYIKIIHSCTCVRRSLCLSVLENKETNLFICVLLTSHTQGKDINNPHCSGQLLYSSFATLHIFCIVGADLADEFFQLRKKHYAHAHTYCKWPTSHHRQRKVTPCTRLSTVLKRWNESQQTFRAFSYLSRSDRPLKDDALLRYTYLTAFVRSRRHIASHVISGRCTTFPQERPGTHT